MEDERAWKFEETLWTGSAESYRDGIDTACVMVLPAPPFVMTGDDAVEAVVNTPRWSSVHFSDQNVVRPQDGLIVLAYHAYAEREGSDPYEAYCTSTLRRLGHDEWVVVQHQQTPPATLGGRRDL